ncbi:hypothetical protein [Paenibacillus humicola]|uniref:hypothetical protein n=1 Tax=Paenibacillus humicola TaxID=3110540 RepID=UPI00237ADE4E|nr:hypothetical protein [Paenibacillus humicola]
MEIFGLLVVFTLLAWIDLPRLWRKKQWAEMTVYGVLLAAGFTLGFLPAIGVDLPNPDKPIAFLIKKLASGS